MGTAEAGMPAVLELPVAMTLQTVGVLYIQAGVWCVVSSKRAVDGGVQDRVLVGMDEHGNALECRKVTERSRRVV